MITRGQAKRLEDVMNMDDETTEAEILLTMNIAFQRSLEVEGWHSPYVALALCGTRPMWHSPYVALALCGTRPVWHSPCVSHARDHTAW